MSRKTLKMLQRNTRRSPSLPRGTSTAYVNLALALIELKEFNEAVDVLENAKEQTSDPKVLNTLSAYITKIRNHQAKGVR